MKVLRATKENFPLLPAAAFQDSFSTNCQPVRVFEWPDMEGANTVRGRLTRLHNTCITSTQFLLYFMLKSPNWCFRNIFSVPGPYFSVFSPLLFPSWGYLIFVTASETFSLSLVSPPPRKAGLWRTFSPPESEFYARKILQVGI